MTKVDSKQIFQAEWPESLKPTVFGRLAGAVYSITPIGILHYSLFWVARFLIHPASALHTLDEKGRRKLLSMGGKIVTYKTPDGETLEGMLFKSRVSDKGVVCALGNGFPLDHALDQVEFFKEYVDSNLLVLNYRGVGHSTGSSSPTGLALDVYTSCEYLHQVHGVDPSEEIVYGHSLGGYAAVKGGALFQKAHPDAEVSVVNDRSFGTLSYAAYLIAGSPYYILAFLLGWELDARDDWDVFKGKKIVVYNKEDRIPFPASFFKAVENKPDTTFVEMDSDAPWPKPDPHMRRFTPSEAREIGRALA